MDAAEAVSVFFSPSLSCFLISDMPKLSSIKVSAQRNFSLSEIKVLLNSHPADHSHYSLKKTKNTEVACIQKQLGLINS